MHDYGHLLKDSCQKRTSKARTDPLTVKNVEVFIEKYGDLLRGTANFLMHD